MDERKSHVCSTDKSESKGIIFNAGSLEKSESESVHIRVNTIKVKDAVNETKDEEPPVTDNPVINDPSYFKLFKWYKSSMKNIDATFRRACMSTPQEKWDM